MNDEVLVSVGRQFIESCLQREGLFRRVQELEKHLAEMTTKFEQELAAARTDAPKAEKPEPLKVAK